MTPAMTDVDLAMAKLRGLAETVSPDAGLTFVAVGTPIPKARARWSPKQKRFFTPTSTQRAEGELVRAFRQAHQRRPPLTDTVAIVALFFVPTKRRKDVDNLMKLVMDAGTKARIWLDDSQVIVQAALLELDSDSPRTVVAVCPCLGTLTRAPLLTEGTTTV